VRGGEEAARQRAQQLAPFAAETANAQLCDALSRPTVDPREQAPPPLFRDGVLKLADVTEGMELWGTVRNVVDFGLFVDVGE